RKANIGGIRVTFNLIFGYPGETEAERAITFRTMSEIGRQFSNVRFSPNIFTPYPGIPIWPQLRELGVDEPKTLKQWGDLALGVNMLPWLQEENLDRFNRMLDYFLLGNQIRQSFSGRPQNPKQVMDLMLLTMIRWRIDRGYYEFPLEMWWTSLTKQ